MTHLATYDLPDPRIERFWRELEAVARQPYSLSWGWVENWLAHKPIAPSLAVIHDDDGHPIAAAFEELPVLRGPAFPELGMLSAEAFRVVIDREIAVPHVDLDTVRSVEGGYISMLPAATRARLNHARRQLGELEVTAATTLATARAFFDEMIALQRGAEDPLHRRLLDQRFASGELQMLRVRSERSTLGCMLSSIWNGRVSPLAAGYLSPDDGDICHAEAVRSNAESGHAFHEVLAQDADRFATGQTRQIILRLQRRTPPAFETSKNEAITSWHRRFAPA